MWTTRKFKCMKNFLPTEMSYSYVDEEAITVIIANGLFGETDQRESFAGLLNHIVDGG